MRSIYGMCPTSWPAITATIARWVRTAQIAATHDLDALRAWLARFADTKTTFENYRKEAERLLLWAIVQLGKPLSSLTHEDLLVYQRFLADPQPRERWVAGGGRKHPRHDSRWRPFYGPLAATSQRQAMVILNVMFAWLVDAGYLAGNPLSLSRQRARRAKPRITRYLEPDLWQEVKLYIDAMPRETDRERAHYFRARWLFTLLYLGGLRITEVSANTMGRFFGRRDADGQERWWLEMLGKGGISRRALFHAGHANLVWIHVEVNPVSVIRRPKEYRALRLTHNQGRSKVEISGSSGLAKSARDLHWRANSDGDIHCSAEWGRASL